MYEVNTCSPIWDSTPVSSFNIKLIRVLLVVVLMLLFTLYIIIHLLLKKSVQNLKADDSGQRFSEKQTFMNRWEKQYLLMFGDHVVAVGFVICFSPYQIQITLSLIFFLLRCAHEILVHKYGKFLKLLKTLLRVINLSLLVCAMVGLSRTGFDVRMGVCRDPDYRQI